MIIKFDHISYSAPIDKEEAVRESFSDYNLIFEERGLNNLEIKSGFFMKEHELHNILMLNAEGKYPIELTMYDECYGQNAMYELGTDEIIIKSADVASSARFYEAFDFTRTESESSDLESCTETVLTLKPMFDSKVVSLRLVKSSITERTVLDANGFGSLALVVDSIDRYGAVLAEAGYSITDIQSLVVNGKTLKIAFASGKNNEIVELIGVR